MPIDRTNWTALIDDDGSNLVGTAMTKDKIKTVILDPIDAAIARMGWTLITTVAVTAVASIDVIAGLGYREILVVIKGVATASAAFIRLHPSIDGGATWLTAGGDASAVGTSGTGGAAGIDFHTSANTAARTAWLEILNFNGTTEPKLVTSGIGAGAFLINSTAVLNALQLIPTSGNFVAGGNVYVYGRD